MISSTSNTTESHVNLHETIENALDASPFGRSIFLTIPADLASLTSPFLKVAVFYKIEYLRFILN